MTSGTLPLSPYKNAHAWKFFDTVSIAVVGTLVSILDFVSCKLEVDSNDTGYVYTVEPSSD